MGYPSFRECILGCVEDPPSEKGFYAWPYVPLNYAETHCEREYRCLTANHLQDTCVNFGGVVCCINIWQLICDSSCWWLKSSKPIDRFILPVSLVYLYTSQVIQDFFHQQYRSSLSQWTLKQKVWTLFSLLNMETRKVQKVSHCRAHRLPFLMVEMLFHTPMRLPSSMPLTMHTWSFHSQGNPSCTPPRNKGLIRPY